LLSEVEIIFNELNIEYLVNYKEPIYPAKDLPSRLRPYQIEAISALNKSSGILCMPTGSGKTLVVTEYLRTHPEWKSIVIVPTIDIRTQWQEYNVPNMLVSTYQNPELKKDKFLEQFDVLVFDECHHVAAKSLYALSMKCKTAARLIGVSATTRREDGEDMRITGALGKIIYSVSRSELIKQGFLANAKVYYLECPFPNNGRYMTYQDVYSSNIINNELRNNAIISLAKKEARNQRKILILVSQIMHGDMLYMALQEENVVFMNGKVKDRKRDMSKYDIIIATSIYDEGYDLPILDTIILAAGGKSSIKLTQRIGRVLRPKADGHYANIFDFIDTPKYLRQHYMRRRAILEQDFEVQNVTI
jgi:superfamily II DNA or RNA helicase